MKVLGILVRTRSDKVMEMGFSYADEILSVSRKHGHIFIDLAGEMATKENLVRIIDGIGAPSGDFLKLIVFYTHGNTRSPIDQKHEDFITDENLGKFANWGVYCIGCDIGQTLGHRLLAVGASFLIAFNSPLMFVVSHAEEVYRALNSGILAMLCDDLGPSAATEHMRKFFLDSIDRIDTASRSALMRKLSLKAHAKSLVFQGSDPRADHVPTLSQPAIQTPISDFYGLERLKPGHEDAAEYQQLVAKILHDLFTPQLDEPHLEVANESGVSRYDVVFMNRAEKGFWHDIKVSRGNSIVIFDAKNKKDLEPSDADQMLRYSSPWRGTVVFVVCRTTPTKAFITRTTDLLKEKNVCLIVLSDDDLKEMRSLKERNQDPTTVIERRFRERIERT